MNTKLEQSVLAKPSVETVPAGSIVVGIDGSSSSHRALSWAVDQAVAEHRALTVVHATGALVPPWIDQAMADPYAAREAMLTAAGEVLGEARREAERWAAGRIEVHGVLRMSDARELLEELSEDAAMLVLGSHGRGPVRSALLGSVGVSLVRRAACPVVIHRPGHLGAVRNGVLVGVEGTARSMTALDFAFRLAAQRDLPLTVLHCFWDVEAATTPAHLVGDRSDQLVEQRLLLAETISGMTELYPQVRVRTELARGLPDRSLVLMGQRMDVLVVGASRGEHQSALTFGSVATSVVEHATCAVAVVPEPTK
ncbi:MAG: universal stress protein [Nocardioides sp.]